MADTDRGLAPTGIPGLDDVLSGGFTRNRLFLVEGDPGAGKTTLGLQFLAAGAEAGETVLYVTLSETEAEIRSVAMSHGWTLEGVSIREISPPEAELEFDQQNTMFHPAEIELAATIQRVLGDVDLMRPSRVVFDSLSELRLLAGTPLRYRRQILALKRYFANRQCTVLLLDDLSTTERDLQVQSIAHGVLHLGQLQPEFGSQRRRLRVIKYRGAQFRGGFHDYAIQPGGLRVFPRLVAAEHRRSLSRVRLSSAIPGIDALLGGGIEEGTSTLFVGAAGTGKSTLAAQFASAAADRGERVALFLFDENPQTMLSRCDELDIALRSGASAGRITLQQVDPAELTPGELTHAIREQVAAGAKLIVIDSLNGYMNAMPEERFLIVQLHELLTYLSQQGVATILVSAHQGLIGGQMQSPVDASYLADAIVLLRYFEVRGEVRQAVSVVKKRGGAHERTIREFHIGPRGVHVGAALREFRGVLTGVPTFEGPAATSQ